MRSTPAQGLGGEKPSAFKKRKVPRACDFCRQRKIRCEIPETQGERCTQCISYNSECTFMGVQKKPSTHQRYVETLENRLQRMENLFQRLHPDLDLNRELDEDQEDSWLVDKSPSRRTRPISSPLEHNSFGLTISGASNSSSSACLQDDDDLAHVTLAEHFTRVSVEATPTLPQRDRFFGKSSSFLLVQKAADEIEQRVGKAIKIAKRVQFWTQPLWELPPSVPKNIYFDFPEPDLLVSLVDLYFANFNLFLPLLHRPTFERNISAHLHLRDNRFAAILLVVSALGSKQSDDPRVFLEGADSTNSCGWKWFNQGFGQIQTLRKSMEAPHLYELQLYALAVLFLMGSSIPMVCWDITGAALRAAQEVGAHRRKAPGLSTTPEDEQWKRAFWVLVCIDRVSSTFLGRPVTVHDEDFDLEYPEDCDDEYWGNSDSTLNLAQPSDKPSKVAFFICLLKLYEILGIALRTIYAINKSKVQFGFLGQHWEEKLVSELDSALNGWVDSVPDHLRWDPHRENEDFFNQSAYLYTTYYYVQILVHRPFIPSPGKASPLKFPSMAICAQAARSAAHVLCIQSKKPGNVMLPPQVQMILITATVVLLLNLWAGKRSGISINTVKEMEDIRECMKVLRSCEGRWYCAGRAWDMLYELVFVGDLPFDQPDPSSTSKRARSDELVGHQYDTNLSSSSSAYTSPSLTSDHYSSSTTSNPFDVPSGNILYQPLDPESSSTQGRLPFETANFWDPTAMQDNDPNEIQWYNISTHANAMGNMATASTGPQDDLFFAQLAAIFSCSFEDATTFPPYLQMHDLVQYNPTHALSLDELQLERAK